VYLDSSPQVPADPSPSPQDDLAAQAALKASATQRLIGLGLTEEEARAVSGYSGDLPDPAAS